MKALYCMKRFSILVPTYSSRLTVSDKSSAFPRPQYVENMKITMLALQKAETTLHVKNMLRTILSEYVGV